MVRDQEHDRVVGQQLQDLADLGVEVAVVVVHRLLERRIRLVQDVLRVVVLPEPVMDPVEPDVNEVEVVPLLGPDQMPDDLELRPAHGEDRVAEPGLVLGAEARGVHRVVAHQLADLVGELGRVREDVLVGIGREEAAHGQPVDLPRGIAGRHADDDRPLPLAGQVIPDGRLGDRPRRGDAQARIRVVRAVAEAIDAQRAGILAGCQAHPGRHRDRRDHALQPAVAAHLHQPPDVGQVLVAEEQLGRGTVEAQDEDLHDRIESPSMAGPRGTPSAARIVGARSSSRAPSRNGRFMNSTPGTFSGSMI